MPRFSVKKSKWDSLQCHHVLEAEDLATWSLAWSLKCGLLHLLEKSHLPAFSPFAAQISHIPKTDLVGRTSRDHPDYCPLSWNPCQCIWDKQLWQIILNCYLILLYYFNFYVGVSYFPHFFFLPVSAQPALSIMSDFIFSTSGHTAGPMNASWIGKVFAEDSFYTQWFWMLRKIQARREVQSLPPRNSGTKSLEPGFKGLSLLKRLGAALDLGCSWEPPGKS